MRCTLVEKASHSQKPWPEEIPPGLLKKGLQISVQDPKSQGEPAERLYEVLDWSLVLHGDSETELLIEVHEIRPSAFSSLSEDQKVFLVTTSVVLTLGLTALLWFAIKYFPEPTAFWGFVGQYIRGSVALALAALGINLSWRFGGYARRATFAQRYLNFLSVMLGVLAACFWLWVSLRPAGMSGSPERNILYLEYLMARARTAWPLMAGVLPWLALGLEPLGFKVLSKVADFLAKRAERSKK